MLIRWFAGVSQDFRQAVWLLRRQPVFALGAVLVLALGVGFVTALLTFLNAELFRPWQIPDSDSVALIRAPQAGEVSSGISIAEYRYLRDHSAAFRRRSCAHRSLHRHGPSHAARRWRGRARILRPA